MFDELVVNEAEQRSIYVALPGSVSVTAPNEAAFFRLNSDGN